MEIESEDEVERDEEECRSCDVVQWRVVEKVTIGLSTLEE
jgi:hypothetical protein